MRRSGFIDIAADYDIPGFFHVTAANSKITVHAFYRIFYEHPRKTQIYRTRQITWTKSPYADGMME